MIKNAYPESPDLYLLSYLALQPWASAEIQAGGGNDLLIMPPLQ